MKQLIILLMMSALLWCATCEPFVESVYSISLRNDTNQALSYTVSFNYPDTLIPSDYTKLRGLPATKTSFYDSKKDWDKVFKEDLPGDTLSFFIFTDVVTEDNWESVRANYEVAKRYDLSLQDLERLNWTVVYPPDNSMQGIKMYPK
jgi:hypothetical protein